MGSTKLFHAVKTDIEPIFAFEPDKELDRALKKLARAFALFYLSRRDRRLSPSFRPGLVPPLLGSRYLFPDLGEGFL